MEKINCILLVDDSPSTNFLHKKIIEVSNEVENIFDVENGLEALNYLEHQGKFTEGRPIPNIIFLDINMPKMNGFEFLEKYAQLPLEKKTDTIIVFLTTSNWSKDKELAFEGNLVHEFIEKPLKQEDLRKITSYYHNKFTSNRRPLVRQGRKSKYLSPN